MFYQLTYLHQTRLHLCSTWNKYTRKLAYCLLLTLSLIWVFPDRSSWFNCTLRESKETCISSIVSECESTCTEHVRKKNLTATQKTLKNDIPCRQGNLRIIHWTLAFIWWITGSLWVIWLPQSSLISHTMSGQPCWCHKPILWTLFKCKQFILF